MSARGRFALAGAAGRFVWSARRHWQNLPADRRGRLQALMQKSRGRPGALSPAERNELAQLVRELELGRLIRDAATTAAPRRGFGRR